MSRLLHIQIILIVILAFYVNVVKGIKCYECTTERNSACGDPFGLVSADTDYIKSGCSVCVKASSSATNVVRGCRTEDFPVGCQSQSQYAGIKGIVCHCNKDQCNSGRALEYSLKSLFPLMLLSTWTLL